MRKLIASIILLSLSGCAQEFYSAQCAKQFGYQKGSAENSNCATNAARQGMQESQNALLAGATVGLIAAASQPDEPSQDYGTPRTSRAEQSPHICPNGTYVVGQCTLAPNGSYVSGNPRIAPDGSYVAGTPRMAPDGSYVGGTGRVTLCPNGKYVAGNRCVIAPDGSYVGAP